MKNDVIKRGSDWESIFSRKKGKGKWPDLIWTDLVMWRRGGGGGGGGGDEKW
jgi:hypothetical protein